MKYFMLLLAAVLLTACNQQNDNPQYLQLKNRIDSLQKTAYKPGFGEFMSNIQVHHEKLWFAGINQNWELADFEINEIKESLGDIKKFCSDRPETQSISMIIQPLHNLSNAIQQKNVTTFKSSYITLTTTCNSCHQATNHGYNVITIPTTPPFSDQIFKLQKNSKGK